MKRGEIARQRAFDVGRALEVWSDERAQRRGVASTAMLWPMRFTLTLFDGRKVSVDRIARIGESRALMIRRPRRVSHTLLPSSRTRS